MSAIVQPAVVKFVRHLNSKLAEVQLLVYARDTKADILCGQYLTSNPPVLVWSEEGCEAVSACSAVASPVGVRK